jgi:hypothetical protein
VFEKFDELAGDDLGFLRTVGGVGGSIFTKTHCEEEYPAK